MRVIALFVFALLTPATALAQTGYFDTLTGDMYYGVRTYGQFFETDKINGAETGFTPPETNNAPLLSREVTVDAENGVGIAGALGIHIGFSSRAEFEASWTQYHVTACTQTIPADAEDGTAYGRGCRKSDDDVYGLMLNLYHDFDYLPLTSPNIAPFVGVGLGYAFANNELVWTRAKDGKEPKRASGGTYPADITYAADADTNTDDTILRGHINDDGTRWGVYGGITLWGVEIMYRYWGGERNTRGHILSLGYRF